MDDGWHTPMLNIQQLPFPNISRRSRKSAIVTHTLNDDLSLDQWIIPKGTRVKLQQTENFGWVYLLAGTKDKRGFEVPRYVFKY